MLIIRPDSIFQYNNIEIKIKVKDLNSTIFLGNYVSPYIFKHLFIHLLPTEQCLLNTGNNGPCRFNHIAP